MNLKNITVAGSGVLGSQIAFQTAFKGFNVKVYDINDEAIEKAKERFTRFKDIYKIDMNATDQEIEDAYSRISYYSNLEEASKDADLVIEAVPEATEIKTAFYKNLSLVAPEKTIFVSNSSTLLPSQFADITGRPEKYLHLHFANEIWRNNTAEVMGHERTNPEVFNTIVSFSKAIGMIPLPIDKEQPGYLLNSLLVPLLNAAESLLVNEVADHETIDKAWMLGTGAPKGPFAMLDIVGLHTPYNIALARAQAGDAEATKVAKFLKEEFIDKGRLGKQNGKGFYDYPNPAFEDKDFLK